MKTIRNFQAISAITLGLLLPLAANAQFTYTNNGDNTITITGYTGAGGNVTIPSNINGFLVASIGDRAFYNRTSLTNVMIPISVTSIGYAAFAYDGLTSIGIPNSVTNMSDAAFLSCDNLTSITIPNSVTSIGYGAFEDCINLTSVTIGSGLKNIQDTAFSVCTSLTNVTIPNSVTSIGNYAFSYCFSLTSITIPNSITSIGDGAFEECTNLSSVNFKGNASNAGLDVFKVDDEATVYYLPGTMGWSTNFAGRPTALWVLPYPVILATAPIGIQTNGFGFTISWATNIPVVVEASTTFANPVWSPVQTNALNNGVLNFTDSDRTKYPSRFYRVR